MTTKPLKTNKLIHHLIELRTRLIQYSVCLALLFGVLFYYSEKLYTLTATPLLNQLPLGSQLIAIDVTSPFMIPMKLSFYIALLLSAPFGLYQLWAFIAPGLYQKEKKHVLPLCCLSIALFYCGVCFAYFVIAPLALSFFTNSAPTSVTVMTDISHYLSFILTLAIAAGLAFQVPMATVLCVRLKVCSKETLAKQRPYVIILAFVFGMLLTPPDVISQVLLALPMWGLFELGLLFSISQKS